MRFLDILNAKPSREKVVLGKLIRILPGGRKAIYESSVGAVRKPYPNKK